MPTQLPRVPSLIPSSFATRAIGRDVSITIFTASSLNSGEKLFFARGNYLPFQRVHPIGWTVRKPRGTSLEGDGVAEGFELGDQPAGFPFGVQAAGEVAGTEFVVGLPGGQDVPDDDDQGVG